MRFEGLAFAAEGYVAVGLPLEQLGEHGLDVGVVVLPPEAVLLREHAVGGAAPVAVVPGRRGPGHRGLGEPRGRLLWLVGRRDRAAPDAVASLHHRRLLARARAVAEGPVVVVVVVVLEVVLGGGARGRGPAGRRRRGCRVGRAAAGSSATAAAAAAGPRHCQRR